jgi:uncharacterized protein (UPF0332 family)
VTLTADLLAQAEHLLRVDRGRPRQASLRRSVSAAYYALFHLLVADGVAELAVAKLPGVRRLHCRAFVHSEMREVAETFARGTLPKHVASALRPPSAGLRRVAEAFQELREARHHADYNVYRRFSRDEASTFVAQARVAAEAWRRLPDREEARSFLHALFAWRRWKR